MIHLFSLFSRIYNFTSRLINRKQFKSFGENSVYYPLGSSFTYQNISIGNDVHIGEEARFWCTESAIVVKDHVVFGPRVSIIAGNHSFHIPGKWITQYRIEDKRPQDDLPVQIDEDVWVGTNVVILNGVHIGRGCVIAAGAVVSKDVSPYSIWGGVPAKHIKFRWTIDEIMAHERALYPENERYTETELRELFQKYSK